jgi:hypothetical protein
MQSCGYDYDLNIYRYIISGYGRSTKIITITTCILSTIVSMQFIALIALLLLALVSYAMGDMNSYKKVSSVSLDISRMI